MNIRIIIIAMISALILLTPGISAQNLLSLDYSFTETWNNGNPALPTAGSLIIPKGPGIITISITSEPFWKAGTTEGPDQIEYKNYGNPKAGTDLGLHLGDTYYQRETKIESLAGVTDRLPLTTISRYYSNLESEKTLSTRILPVIARNTNHQLACRIRYTADWEPIVPGRASKNECDVTGIWKTNRGDMTLAYAPDIDGLDSLAGNFTSQRTGTFDGIISGPVLTGTWSEPGSSSKNNNSGRFTLIFKDSCCVFSGTWGSGESDTSGGEWSGNRA